MWLKLAFIGLQPARDAQASVEVAFVARPCGQDGIQDGILRAGRLPALARGRRIVALRRNLHSERLQLPLRSTAPSPIALRQSGPHHAPRNVIIAPMMITTRRTLRIALAMLAVAGLAIAAPFTLPRITSYPFPNELASAATGSHIVWAVDSSGTRNLYVAEAPDFTPRKLTNYTTDDGRNLPAWPCLTMGDPWSTCAAAIMGAIGIAVWPSIQHLAQLRRKCRFGRSRSAAVNPS